MKHIILAAALCAASPVGAEVLRGGRECDPAVWYSTCYMIAQREAQGSVRLDGWYYSADTAYIASPRACIVAEHASETQFLFHAAHSGNGHGAIPSIWNGIRAETPAYTRMMNRSPWGRRIYAYVLSQGWLDSPAYTTMTGTQAIAMGVPACR